MNMQMHDRLTSVLTDIDSNIVSVWSILPINDLLRLVNQFPQFLLDLRSGIEVSRIVVIRYDQYMTWIDRVTVPVGKSMLAPNQGAFRYDITKPTPFLLEVLLGLGWHGYGKHIRCID